MKRKKESILLELKDAQEMPFTMFFGANGTAHIIPRGGAGDDDLFCEEAPFSLDETFDPVEVDQEFWHNFDPHFYQVQHEVGNDWWWVPLTIRENRRMRQHIGCPPAHPPKTHK
ncbi:hypothetical protein H0W80_03760 [Candidatus Saccharibacteria bacterium]|nr:hypothetical protein [Candidatus Saccharibacteria bacterium]